VQSWIAPFTNNGAKVTSMKAVGPSKRGEIDTDHQDSGRRQAMLSIPILLTTVVSFRSTPVHAYSGPTIDVNNAMAREFTAFPGLFPTIATKIVKAANDKPFKTKQDVYNALDTDLEKDRLKQYDQAILISKPDSAVKQFKASQICKYECGSRVSSSYRDEQIKAVQDNRY